MDWHLVQWVAMLRKPTAREAITTFLLLLPLFTSILYRLYAKIRRRDGRSVGLQILSDEYNDDQVKYEIIAVHGLGANPEHTWTCKPNSKSKTSDSQKPVHLLKDLLMKDERFSDARILHFAYNSDWLVDACFESARDIGLRLIESVIEHRKTHLRLPLIFVGHSFGGIVIKEALSSDLKDTERIVEDTCGIIFLGTPHLGSPIAGFGATLAYLTGFLGSNTGLLLLLRSNGEMLVNLSIAFQSCLERKYQDLDKKTKIVSICEQKPTYLMNWLYAGLIVPLASATFGTNFMEVFKVDKDHSGLNKCFNLEDPLYKVLTAQLHKIRPTAPPKINTLQQAVLDRLMPVTAADAEFHPGLDEYGRALSECLPQTREEILKDICDWLDDSTSLQKHLYWLQGKAGTGKSTIARTIVSRMARQNRIAANFFFKRGGGDRARLKRFFTTLAAQLVRQWPSFAKAVQEALESDPSLPEQDPRIQFEKLIQEPLRKQEHKKSKVIMIVVDAHDECDLSEDLTSLVQQLTQSQDGHSTQPLVKCFLTSRLYHHTQYSFNSISEKRCEKKELEKATSATIRSDIERYLRDELEKIDGLLDPLPGGDLWSNPSDVENLKKLTERACPLFEFAAFSTRFIKQTNMPGGPRGRLHYILETQISGDLNDLYDSIIKRRFYGLDDQCHEKAEANFQKIIGSVVFLANAVTVRCLAEILKLPEREIREELQTFESVLVVPAEQDDQSLITLFHESFRDFFSGSGTTKKLTINYIEVHTMLASRCHQLLCGALRENMCKLKRPGTYRSEVTNETVNEFLPQEVQYACRFWIFHVKRSQSSIKDGDNWHSFLLSHFLHWLETLSLLGRTSESASLVKELKTAVHPSDAVQVKAFLEDAERLIASFRYVIDAVPLQLYSSVLTFAPAESLVRENFDAYRTKWISRLPNVDSQWSPCLQTFEGHPHQVKSLSFSPDETWLASASCDCIVKIWDARIHESKERNTSIFDTTGIKMPTGDHCLAMNQRLAMISAETSEIQLLDDSGSKWVAQPFKNAYANVAISANGNIFGAVLDDRTGIEIWDSESGNLLPAHNRSSLYIRSIAFSANGDEMKHNPDVYTEEFHLSVPHELQHYFAGGKECLFENERLWHWPLNTSFINFDFAVGTDLPEPKPWEDCLAKYYISLDGVWIMRHREKLLWILPEYRPKGAITSGSKIAIERVSGHPYVIELLDEDL
ncbi:WD domain, g-beta repeat domain-containing protein [Trichoderma breve]|uniref:WD domain, g-beta repeat domain-containing protein n=1 Tax=Trichoderma breve TaxID=2034170 RepID=A0A9W9BCK4_9HYPO|nr:WD domain, g-beta repeat domain-containing protein [Trichoderma breve]KAJ4857850.1 WD domain, g-beta repeat domain-containing protein [Trichoderma breve]